MDTDRTDKPRRVDEHERARDGRKAHPGSTAPYGIEEHMNEEQTKHAVVEKRRDVPGERP